MRTHKYSTNAVLYKKTDRKFWKQAPNKAILFQTGDTTYGFWKYLVGR